jgi:hypothetical protein
LSWKISTIIPIPKKGDLTDPNKHRGIAITSQVAKTLNRMILNRLRPEVEKLLRTIKMDSERVDLLQAIFLL